MLAVVTFLWGDKYPAEYVAKLRNMVARNLHVPHDFICITERQLRPYISTPFIMCPEWPKFEELQGCYRRLKLFSLRGFFDYSRIVMLDLDLVITGDVTPLLTGLDPITIYKCKAQGSRGYALNPGILAFNAGALKPVWDYFSPDPNAAIAVAKSRGWSGTDQAIMGLSLDQRAGVRTIGERDGVLSFRDHFKFRERPTGIEGARIVSFHSKSNPSDQDTQAKFPWIREHWR